jgi:hypothetical protein
VGCEWWGGMIQLLGETAQTQQQTSFHHPANSESHPVRASSSRPTASVAMEKIVETFASYPSERDLSEDQLRKQSNLILVNYIYPVPASQLAKNLSDGRSLLDVLNPEFNTLPYVFVLYVFYVGESFKLVSSS